MAFTPKAGWNGLIYVSGTVLEGANAWSVETGHESVDVSRFGNADNRVLAGTRANSGSITAWHDQAAKVLQNAADADVLVSWKIYPDESDVATYYSGNAVFGFSSDGARDAAVGQECEFTNDNAITKTGFS